MPISLFSLYSLFIGTYTSNNMVLPLSEEYANLPAGLYYQVTQKIRDAGFIIPILVNLILWKPNTTVQKLTHCRVFINGSAYLLYVIFFYYPWRIQKYRPNVLRVWHHTSGYFFSCFHFRKLCFVFNENACRKKSQSIPPSILVIILILLMLTSPNLIKCQNACGIKTDCHISKHPHTVRWRMQIVIMGKHYRPAWLGIKCRIYYDVRNNKQESFCIIINKWFTAQNKIVNSCCPAAQDMPPQLFQLAGYPAPRCAGYNPSTRSARICNPLRRISKIL